MRRIGKVTAATAKVRGLFRVIFDNYQQTGQFASLFHGLEIYFIPSVFNHFSPCMAQGAIESHGES